MARAAALAAVVFCLLTMSWPSRAVLAEQREAPVPEAWDALESGRPEQAASLFRQALERSPQNAALHLGAGWAAYALGRYDAATSALKKALDLDPALTQAAVLLAQSAYANSDLDLAIRSMEKAAALRPRDRAIAQQLQQWRKEASVHAGLDERPGLRFRVLYEGGTQAALGRHVERTLESAYWSIGKSLNSYPADAITVVLYTDRQFQEVTRLPGWAGGAFDGRIRLAVGGAMSRPDALDRLVRHELAHAIIHTAAPRNIPAWVHEGLASVFESTDRTWIARSLRSVTEVYPLDDLANGFAGLDGASASVAYAESAVAGQILCDRLGPNLGVFLQMLGNGYTVDQALATLGVPADSFHQEFRRRVDNRRRPNGD